MPVWTGWVTRSSFNDGWGRAFYRHAGGEFRRGLFVQRSAERVDDPSQKVVANRHPDHIASAIDLVAGLDLAGRIQHHAADPVAVKNLGEAELTLAEAQQLIQPDILKSGNHRHAVANFLYPPDLVQPRSQFDVGQSCFSVNPP